MTEYKSPRELSDDANEELIHEWQENLIEFCGQLYVELPELGITRVYVPRLGKEVVLGYLSRETFVERIRQWKDISRIESFVKAMREARIRELRTAHGVLMDGAL